MRGKSLLCLLVLGLMVFASTPVANAQIGTGTEGLNNPSKPTPTTLYFHIFDTFNAFPINTQAPNVTFFQVGGTNFPTVVEPNSQTNYDFNTIYGFATAGPVEYDFIENGQPRFHPERGIARDVLIDGKTQPYVYIYVEVRDIIGATVIPNMLPKFTFRFSMGKGNVIGPDSDLDNKERIMEGELTAYLWSVKDADGNPVPPPATSVPDANCAGGACPLLAPDQYGVIEYKIPLTFTNPTNPVIPKADAYHVRIDWYQDPSGQNRDQFAEGYMRIVSDEHHHSRLTMAITNPVYFEFIHPQVASGILLIHTAENSPWGTYDIDVYNMTVEMLQGERPMHITISDASGVIYDSGGDTPVEAALQIVVAQNAHVHDRHDDAAEVTYLWRFREAGAPVGDYRIRVAVQNLNHTATAYGEASFIVKENEAYGVSDKGEEVTNPNTPTEEQSSPAASLLVVLVLVAGAAMWRRRKA